MGILGILVGAMIFFIAPELGEFSLVAYTSGVICISCGVGIVGVKLVRRWNERE